MASNVARRLDSLTKRLDSFDRIVVRIAGEAVHDALIEELVRDTGDRALSGIGGGRYKLDVQLTPLSNPAGVRIRPRAKQSGMWTILSSGTSAHAIFAKPKRRHVKRLPRGSSRLRAVKVGGTSWRVGPVRVSGSRGHGTWTRGRDRGFDEAITAVRRVFHEAVNDG